MVHSFSTAELSAPENAGTELTCITGTVNVEMESGIVTYDDSHQETCTFGTNYCYKQTMQLSRENWPSKKV